MAPLSFWGSGTEEGEEEEARFASFTQRPIISEDLSIHAVVSHRSKNGNFFRRLAMRHPNSTRGDGSS